jgi:hypothetical protein
MASHIVVQQKLGLILQQQLIKFVHIVILNIIYFVHINIIIREREILIQFVSIIR